MAIKSYTELVAWQKSVDLVTTVYRLSQKFPKEEVYGLTSQIRRAAVSIPSNIAEGQGRLSTGEFRQFLGHARGSLAEVRTQVHIADRLKYISSIEAGEVLESCNEVGRILNGLLTAITREANH